MELFFTILIPIAAVAIVAILAIIIASHNFKCKHCSAEFKIKWTKVLYTAHSSNEYMLECPCCKVKDWCIKQNKS